MKYQCKKCGAKFATEERAVAHVEKRHADGALWVEGTKALFSGISMFGGYDVVCLKHNHYINVGSKANGLNWVRNSQSYEFCEACAEPDRWCDECQLIIETYAADLDEHHRWRREVGERLELARA